MQTRQIIFWRLPSQVVVSLFLLSILVACGGPGVPNKTVYAVSQNGTIYAVNGKDGTIRWRYHMAGDNGSPWGASNGLELVNGVIYTSSSVSGGYIYALQARDSRVLWHVKVNPEGTPGTPTMMHDVVYVAVANASSTRSQIYALKAGNGSLIWKITITSSASLGMPIVVDNTIYISAQTDSGQGYLYALNARDGLVRWHTQLSSWASSNIVVANGIAYIDDNNSDVYAISTHNGALIWQRHFQILHPNDVHISNLAVANGLVYVGVEQGFLYALRASDGVQQWKVQVADIGDHGVYEPTIAGNVIYAVCVYDTKVYALQAQDGKPLWSYQSLGFFAGSSPVVTGGIVYFSMYDGALYALDEHNGSLVYRYEIDRTLVTSAPLAVEP